MNTHVKYETPPPPKKKKKKKKKKPKFPHKMNSTFSITIVQTYDPRDGASFDPRGIIWIELI